MHAKNWWPTKKLQKLHSIAAIKWFQIDLTMKSMIAPLLLHVINACARMPSPITSLEGNDWNEHCNPIAATEGKFNYFPQRMILRLNWIKKSDFFARLLMSIGGDISSLKFCLKRKTLMGRWLRFLTLKWLEKDLKKTKKKHVIAWPMLLFLLPGRFNLQKAIMVAFDPLN